MAFSLVGVGSTANDGTGDALRTAFQTINANFTAINNGTQPGAFTTLTASGDVNFDSGTLFVDASESRVGIGTTSPGNKLVVSGDTAANATIQLLSSLDFSTIASRYTAFVLGHAGSATQAQIALSSFSGGDAGSRLQIHCAGQIGFRAGGVSVNNSPQVVIDSSGNVGIGTTSPAHELEVANASSPTIRINDTGGTSTAISAWIEGAYAGNQAWFVGMNTGSASMEIGNKLNGLLNLTTNNVTRLTLDGNTGSTGGTGSAGSGNQYVELQINGSRYKLLHDGTL